MDQYQVLSFALGGSQGAYIECFNISLNAETYFTGIQLERNHLICGKPDLAVQNITLPKDKYISNLIGPNLDTEEVQKQLTPGAVSMFQIKKLSTLVDKVKHLMANGNCCPVSISVVIFSKTFFF